MTFFFSRLTVVSLGGFRKGSKLVKNKVPTILAAIRKRLAVLAPASRPTPKTAPASLQTVCGMSGLNPNTLQVRWSRSHFLQDYNDVIGQCLPTSPITSAQIQLYLTSPRKYLRV